MKKVILLIDAKYVNAVSQPVLEQHSGYSLMIVEI